LRRQPISDTPGRHVDFDLHIRRMLADLEASALLRTPRTVTGAQGPELTVDGRRVLGLCSNNYLGLAAHPRIAEAASDALREQGFGSAASRHISGTSVLHTQLEQRLARFLALPSALLFSSGYAANIGAIQALAGPDDVIFSDRLNHASLIDGARLSRARIVVYRHLDFDHLDALLAEHRARHASALVLTESVFSMEGDLANLCGLRALCDRYGCGLVVDEAHALGVLGPQGHGLCARDGVRADVLIGTLGKAFGCTGAFVAGAPDTVRLVENRARSYVFSTAPPASQAAAALAAVELVEAADDRRARVLVHADRLRAGLRALGYRTLPGATPIVPILIGPPEVTMALSAALLEHGVFVHGIRPPTVPADTSRLRVTAIATHTEAHVERALRAFAACRSLI
jgi:8-amino-7-oxononanoate synthase